MRPSIPKAPANLVIWTDANLSSPKTNQRLMDAGLKVITHESLTPSRLIEKTTNTPRKYKPC